MKVSVHCVLVAPSGGLSKQSPGYSKTSWCWKMKTLMWKVGTSAGWQGYWVEMALGRYRHWVEQEKLQVLWHLNPC